ncbi:anoctamin-4-like [Montipora capricornis]|uniref:anoctamin-4-like n=1 Tax=Montipora capricornis TaxID=246305 RepID=UPI0035F16EA8
MFPRLFQRRKDLNTMDRGAYSKLEQNDIPMEMEAENAPTTEPFDDKVPYPSVGGRRIDYVLVYETCKEKEDEDEETKQEAETREKSRRFFEKRLQKKGLVLRRESIIAQKEPRLERHFVLVYAPWELLAKSAEEMRLKVPIQPNDVLIRSPLESLCGAKQISKLANLDPLRVHDATIREKGDYFMGRFKEEHQTKFVNYEDKEIFFSTVDRLYIIQQILENTRFSKETKCVGIKRLVFDGAYTTHYPLHDGTVKLQEGEFPVNDRQRLKRDWARLGRCFKYQPYDAIKDYFGHEIGLYFAWLGFYTAMLVPLAIVALIVFVYGILSTRSHIPVRDLCDDNNAGVWYMCPLCDKQCSYWDLAPTSCLYAYVTHVFDNDGTVILALVASIWATLFLEFWKRRQATLAHQWHTEDFEGGDEPLRPEYVRSLTKDELDPFKPDPETGKILFRATRARRARRFSVVFSLVAFMIALVIAAVIGVVVFRAAAFAVLTGSQDGKVQKRARILTTGLAASINLIAITILKYAYNKLAVWLTNWENPATFSSYEDSFTMKMALFQFVNTFSSIIYIAFFKSEIIVGSPGRYTRVLGKYRLNGCSEQGCFLELAIQIAIIMIGMHLVGNVIEIGIPSFKLWLKRRNLDESSDRPQFIKDYDLSSLEDHFLFWDYLEIVLQYAFVTMFVAAFPLAPFFALINAILEIRVDAVTFVTYYRRPQPVRVEDIGAWYSVLEGISKIAVLMNAFVLAFTSEFIPKLVYKYQFSPDRNSPEGGTLKGYVNNSLALIDLKTLYDWEPGTEPRDPTANVNYTRDYCRYASYRDSAYPYNYSKEYWNLVAARLAFVVAFQFVVYSVTNMIAWIVPDVPEDLQFTEEREKQVVKEKLGTVSDEENESGGES